MSANSCSDPDTGSYCVLFRCGGCTFFSEPFQGPFVPEQLRSGLQEDFSADGGTAFDFDRTDLLQNVFCDPDGDADRQSVGKAPSFRIQCHGAFRTDRDRPCYVLQ